MKPLAYSRKLPIAKFFACSSALIAVLAVVPAGKGVTALQVAGSIDVRPVAMPRIDMFGLVPTLQPVLAQLVVLTVVFLGFWYNLPVAEQRAPTSASISARGSAT